MKSNKRVPQKINYFNWGVFFLVLFVILLIRDIYEDLHLLFWFCDFAVLLFSIAFFLKKDNVIQGLINTGFIIEIYYFLSIVLGYFGIFPFVINLRMITENSNFLLVFISLIIHIPALTSAWLFRYKHSRKITLFYSFLVSLLMLIPSRLFTPAEKNINEVFYSSAGLSNFLPHYTLLWPLWFFLLTILPAYLIRNYIASRLTK